MAHYVIMPAAAALPARWHTSIAGTCCFLAHLGSDAGDNLMCTGQIAGTIYGGENRDKEKARLRKGVNVVVATPGYVYRWASTCKLRQQRDGCAHLASAIAMPSAMDSHLHRAVTDIHLLTLFDAHSTGGCWTTCKTPSPSTWRHCNGWCSTRPTACWIWALSRRLVRIQLR